MKHTFYKFSLGEFDCIVFHDYSENTTLQEVFSDIPSEKLESARMELGLPETYEQSYNVLYVNANGKQVLIDCGAGPIEGFEFLHNLKSAEIDPGEIDFIVITHADGDHYRGFYDADGESVFPNTKIVLWQKAWDLWTNPKSRVQMVDDLIKIFTKKGMEPDQMAAITKRRDSYGSEFLPNLKDSIILVETDTEFLPGFRLLDMPGHRGDHVGVEISSNGETLLHVSDSIKHPIQAAYPDFYGEFDTFPEIITKTNTRTFHQASEWGALIFMAHFTFPGLAKAEAKAGAWEMKPVLT